MTFTYTYYTADCRRKSDPLYGITASGKRATAEHTIAADLKILPLGTVVYIEGMGYRTVEDCASGGEGKWIDIYVKSTKDIPKDYSGKEETIRLYIVKKG